MGVPKFYRWLSERYPCLSQTIKEHQIPEFDNLYLDMNGIIHPCSHPNNEDPHFRITEEQIITNVFEYIENLFRIVKPRKNLFMAVDGCAPRAKMNQQRTRRFRTAKESSEAMQHALDKGELLPNDNTFDSNCITPGTEFMENLQKHLEYFINEKLSNDPLWKDCTVHFSGHDVPGEGEHKIMDYIRCMKSQEDYDPNTRHCLYGLDADLIMLGLSVHEPHFCLLREEVLFEERDRDRMLAPAEQVYHLFHLSLLRDYLHIEFKEIQDKLSFEYDLEKIIDDWIFLGFLVGNDFVPHLPHMHINNDALPYFYSVYKNFLLTADGYLNDGGHLNLHRMKEFFKRISQFDFDIYSEYKKVEKEKSNKIVKKNSGEDGEKEFLIETPEGTEGLSNAFANFSLRKNSQLNRKETNAPEIATGLQAHKEKYYMNKCSIDINKSGELTAICTDYVKALQWISHYYFNGLQSWSWYYPYHYAPYMSDLAQLDISQVHFEMGEALKPFEQLLAVLPSASKQLLPKPFQHLMSNETSEIIEYFPADFETDLNGKKQQYEAVVLIPFIQEDRLLRAMKEHYHQLTPEERKRNTFGDACQFSRDATRTDQHFPPTHPAFPDIKNCPVRKQVVRADQYQLPIQRIAKGVLEGARFDMTGTPTLTNLNHTCDFAREGVQVFKRKSRSESAIIKLNPTTQQEMEETARQLVGERVYVEWPFNVEALVTGLTNEYFHYHLDRNKQLNMKVLAAEEYSSFKKETAVLSAYHTFERGVHLGKVEVLVKARPLLGKRHVYGENNQALLVNEWADNTLLYPLQTVVKKQGEEKYVCGRASDLFAPGSRCVLLSRPHYGHTGEVIGYNDKDDKVNVAINITKEPSLNQIAFDRLSTTEYVSFEVIASQMQLNHDVLARITGDVFIRKQNQDGSLSTYNIGLGIKYTKRNMEMLGYAKRATFGWVFSEQAVRVLDDYMKRYPEIFIALNAKPSPDAVENYFNFHELLPDKNEDYLHEVRTFLKQQACFNGKLIRCQSNVLEAPIVEKIEHVVHQNKGAWAKMLKVKVRPDLLLCPSSHNHTGNKDIYVFDRVVNINHTMRVPFGARGTVIGIHNVFIDKNSVRAKSEHNYEVLFDDLINTSRSLKSAMVKANSIILLNPEKSKIERRFRHQQSLNSQWKKLGVMNLKDTIQRSFCTSARRSLHTSSAVQRPVLCRPSLFTIRTVPNKLVNVRSVKYIASVACFCLLLAR